MKPPKRPAGTPRDTAQLAYRTGSHAPTSPERSLEQALGTQVRHHRLRLGLTATELAAAAGLSTSLLSKIESGSISASLGSLQALAAALNVPITTLFAAFEEQRDCSYVKAGQGVRIERRGTRAGHQYELLGHSLAGPVVVEPYLITLAKDAVPYTAFQHAGVELIHMLNGRVAYRHADRRYALGPGDTMMFDATAAHGPEELTELPTTYLSIIVYPRR
jgi:transcriptional regulator with XRE-family HTH domain